VAVGGLAVEQDHRLRAAAVLGAPDQPPRQRADERVVRVALAPCRERPGPRISQLPLDPVALGGQQRAQLLVGRLQLGERVGVVALGRVSPERPGRRCRP